MSKALERVRLFSKPFRSLLEGAEVVLESLVKLSREVRKQPSNSRNSLNLLAIRSSSLFSKYTD